ncbi:MAG TPA: prepilin-type N-terminal cleavage/methylation domain-containing protein [Candidatus Angelobacter sp.]
MPRVSARSVVSRPQVRGFSLVEILVVVMVILVIAAIAIPNMLQARMRANEAAAVASMNVIHTAEAVYSNTYPQVGYAGNLADLGSHGSNCETTGKTNSCIIRDEALTSGVKGGYTFELVGDGRVPDANYTLTAAPESPGTSGRCAYTADESGQILTTPPNSSPAARSMGGGAACEQS